MVCIRCQKRPAIIFVQRMENGQMKNEGYCLHCAREMHIKPVDDLMKQFGMSDEDMDAMEDRMENMMQEMGDMSNMNPFSMMMGMGQPDQGEEDGDLVPGSSATFPLGDPVSDPDGPATPDAADFAAGCYYYYKPASLFFHHSILLIFSQKFWCY